MVAVGLEQPAEEGGGVPLKACGSTASRSC